jgi:2-polyprenyl-3-methyl-5-hydroxy-6-metoxy-1,4-benzoquinol methylase
MNMKDTDRKRESNEIKHGKALLKENPELTWGWGSAAGKHRAMRRAQLLRHHAKLKPGMKVLEIGCGTGLFTKELQGIGVELTAIDISPDLIEIAKINNPTTTFWCGPFEHFETADSFDAVVGVSVLHHLNMEATLKNSRRILNPFGRFVFSEPNFLNPQIFLERTLLRRFLNYLSPDETAFIRWKLKRDLEKFGFTLVDIQPFDWMHPAIPEPLIPSILLLGRFLEKIPLAKEFAGSLLISCQKR